MSILARKQILEKVTSGEIGINPPLDQFQLQAHAIDLRLGYTFMIPKQWHITPKGREAFTLDHLVNPKDSNHFDIVELEKGQTFQLLPGEYVLASTLETITWPDNLMSVLYPRSSTNRRGISIDLTGIVDAGYSGQLVIPIKNNTTSQIITLYPGERFCQITFEELTEASGKPDGTYHQKDVIDGFMVKENKLDELDFITRGDISQLKEKFSIDIKK